MERHLPYSAQLDGLDISFNQCPPQQWLPKNVRLRNVDIFAEIPPNFVERYDVVHVRHFVCVLKGDDPTPMLYNLLRLLKPGGWLQWDEWDVDLPRHFTKASKHGPQENLDKLREEFAIMRRHNATPRYVL